MNEQLEQLREKAATLAYRVEEFGSYGDERELACVMADLAALEDEDGEGEKAVAASPVSPSPNLLDLLGDYFPRYSSAFLH